MMTMAMGDDGDDDYDDDGDDDDDDDDVDDDGDGCFPPSLVAAELAEVPDAGAPCGATAEGLGAPPVELSHGSRSPAQAAGLASRCALVISSEVSGLAPHRAQPA